MKRRWMLLMPLLMLAATSAVAAGASRIVVLAPNLAELVFAAGAGERLVGTVEYSDYPRVARRIPRVGDAFRIDHEKLLAVRPDLVLAWQSGTPVAVIEKLRGLGLPVAVVQVSQLAQVAEALRQVGKLAGTEASAEQAAQQFERNLATLKLRYADRSALRVFIEIERQPLFTVNGKHLISEIVQLCGGENVFAGVNQLAPAIGIEAVLVADPQVVLSTVRGDPAMSAWRRWRKIDAVRAQRVYQLDPDTLTRATPRVIEGAKQVCEVLDRARAS